MLFKGDEPVINRNNKLASVPIQSSAPKGWGNMDVSEIQLETGKYIMQEGIVGIQSMLHIAFP